MKRSDLAAVLFLAVAGISFAGPVFSRTQDEAQARQCAGNLAQLWKMMHNYRVQYGGRDKFFPQDTGPAFWTKLSRSPTIMIDVTLKEIFECPVEGNPNAVTTTDYRGPSSDVNEYGDGDVVGADLEKNHGAGRGGNVIRMSGDVQTVRANDKLWNMASEKTTAGPAVGPDLSKWSQEKLRAWTDLRTLLACVRLFEELNGKYPAALQDLITRPKDIIVWPEGGFYPGGKIPHDPWGVPYEYGVTARRPILHTLGADEAVGGEGDNEDLSVGNVP